jgi:ATP-dependent exoDNAse (exonuclease V) alpha subunit
MAIYHLRVKFVKRSDGRSSVASAAYRAGEKLQDERTGKRHDYSRREDVAHAKVLLQDGAPEDLRDRSTLWNEIERVNKRKDAQLAFEVELALPRELTPEDRVRLAETFAEREFVSQGLAVDLCIHVSQASDGGEHPHAHMMVTTRRIEDDGTFGKVARDQQDSPALLRKVFALEQEGKLDDALLASKGTNLARWREGWATLCNEFLDEAGEAARIDHRTLAAQKIEREAMPNVGFAFHRQIEGLRGWLADRVDALRGVEWRNSLRNQFDRIRQTRNDLTAEFVAHAHAHAPELIDGIDPEFERGQGRDR